MGSAGFARDATSGAWLLLHRQRNDVTHMARLFNLENSQVERRGGEREREKRRERGHTYINTDIHGISSTEVFVQI